MISLLLPLNGKSVCTFVQKKGLNYQLSTGSVGAAKENPENQAKHIYYQEDGISTSTYFRCTTTCLAETGQVLPSCSASLGKMQEHAEVI